MAKTTNFFKTHIKPFDKIKFSYFSRSSTAKKSVFPAFVTLCWIDGQYIRHSFSTIVPTVIPCGTLNVTYLLSFLKLINFSAVKRVVIKRQSPLYLPSACQWWYPASLYHATHSVHRMTSRQQKPVFFGIRGEEEEYLVLERIRANILKAIVGLNRLLNKNGGI